MSRARHSTCSRWSRPRRTPVRPAQRGLHAASRRCHQRGAGERGAAGCRADVRLPHPRRDLERDQLPLDHRRGSAALRPFIALAEQLGSFAGQLTESGIKEVRITYEGQVAGLKMKALTASAIAGLLRPLLQDVNVVSAPTVAKERGIVVEETTRAAEGDYEVADHAEGRHREAGALRRRHGLSRRQAAHRRHQGHQGGRRVRRPR